MQISYGRPAQELYVFFGANTIGNNTTVRFLMPGYVGTLAPTTPKGLRITDSRRINRISVYANTAGTGTGSYTFTLVKIVAGVANATSLLLTILSTASSGTAIGSVDLVEGDIIGIQITPTGTISSGNDYFVSLGSTDK